MKKEPEQIEREVEQIRGHMEPVIAELDRRRQRLMDWGAEIRRRAPTVIGIAALLIGGGATVRAIGRNRRNGRKRGPRRA
jgi:hypothetical protein